MAKQRVYGFDEDGFRRVQEATRIVLRTPRTGAQRRRQVPVLGGESVEITTTEEGTNGFPIGTGSCDCDNCPEAVPLPGTPTVCCESHLLFTGYVWPEGVLHEFKYKPNDEWATDPEGFDDPDVEESTSCGPTSPNKYRLVRVPSHTWGEDQVRLELVEDNGCPIKCFVYKATKRLRCPCAQEFELVSWDNIDRADLPCRICLKPGEREFVPAVETSCLVLDAGVVQFPGAIDLLVEGFDGWFSSSIGLRRVGEGSPCSAGSPVTRGWIDVNGRHRLTPGSFSAAYCDTTNDPIDTFLCSAYSVPPVGPTVAVTCDGDEHQRRIRFTINYYRDEPPGTRTLFFTAHIPLVSLEGAIDTADVICRRNQQGGVFYRSDDYAFDLATATQVDVDAVFDVPIVLNKCREEWCGTTAAPYTVPDTMYAFSASSTVLSSGLASSSGQCGTPCTTPAADVDDDPGSCCVEGECFHDLDETECGDVAGVWYALRADCEAACSPVMGPSVGGCCRGDGSCDDDIAEEDCQGEGDYWHGGLCASATCTVACCKKTSGPGIPIWCTTDDACGCIDNVTYDDCVDGGLTGSTAYYGYSCASLDAASGDACSECIDGDGNPFTKNRCSTPEIPGAYPPDP